MSRVYNDTVEDFDKYWKKFLIAKNTAESQCVCCDTITRAYLCSNCHAQERNRKIIEKIIKRYSMLIVMSK